MNSQSIAPRPAPFRLDWPPILEEAILPILQAYPDPVYLVGGAVRDAFLRRSAHDLDLVIGGDGRRLAQRIANRLGGMYYPLDDERQVGRALVEHSGERFTVDVAAFRGESLLADLIARDFTINALVVPLNGEQGDLQHVIDPLGGSEDLVKKRLRRCAPGTIVSDPARALRAIRQSVAFKLNIDSETRQEIRRDGPKIVSVSPERVRDEFMTMLGGPRPHVAMRTLDMLDLLTVILPEVEAMRGMTQSAPHIYDVWEHTLQALERLDGVLATISPARTDDSAADTAYGMIVYLLDRFRARLQDHLAAPLPNGRRVSALLALGILLHDSGKPATRSIGSDGRIHFYEHEVRGAELAERRALALRLSNEEITRLVASVRHHMRPANLQLTPEVSRRAVYRFWNATGEPAGVDVCILTMADYLGMVGAHLQPPDWIARLQVIGALLDGLFNRKAEVVAPPPLVGGRELMVALGLAPGPDVGRLLRALAEAQAAGEIATPEQALALAESLRDALPGPETREN